jgi:hypothetical protein
MNCIVHLALKGEDLEKDDEALSERFRLSRARDSRGTRSPVSASHLRRTRFQADRMCMREFLNEGGAKVAR